MASLAVIRELAHLKFFRQPFPLLLNNYHNIHSRRRLNSRQLRLQPDYLLRFTNFCGTVASPKRETQNVLDLSHMILILNRSFVPSLARVINSNKHFVIAECSSTVSFFRKSLSTFSLFIVQYSTVCHKFYPNCQWTVTHCWPNLALDIELLTKVYWSYSTHIVRVCFTPLLKPTLQKDFKCKSNPQSNINSPAMASLYELLCYYSLEHWDPVKDEFPTFFHSTLSSLSSSPAISTVLSEAADGNSNKFYIFQCIPLTILGMCDPNTTEYSPCRGLVKA